ncbi:hypothetical protein FBU30_002923 [Linnemannia zychae]|nr:hypothetical protein FBU30_002923 [Linnemannia zychae]
MSHVSLYIPDQTDAIVASLDTAGPGQLPLPGRRHFKDPSRRWYFKDYLTSRPDPVSILAPSVHENENDEDNNNNNNNNLANNDIVEETQGGVAEVEADGQPKPTFRTTVQPQPPVSINIHKRVTRCELDMRGRKACLYSIILGISAGNADIDQIESIQFQVCKSEGYSEDMNTPSEEVRELLAGNGLARWKLHNQFRKSQHAGTIIIEIEVRTAQNDQYNNTFARSGGSIELHYLELVKEPIGDANCISHDPSLRVHRPYLWSVNVNYSYELSDDLSPTMEIVAYAVSGDGTHVATVAALDQHVYLDVWDLRNPCEFSLNRNQSGLKIDKIDKTDKHSLSSRPSKDVPVILSDSAAPTIPAISPFSPRCSARVSAIDLPENYRGRQVNVSLSWDASMVALLDATGLIPGVDNDRQSAFAVFDHVRAPHSTISEKGEVTSFPATVIRPSKHYHDFTGTYSGSRFKNFFGCGKFHISALVNQDIKDELFITCNMDEVNVYGVYPSWRHIHTVRLDRPEDPVYDLYQPCLQLINTLCGRNFVWDVRNNDGIAVYDVEDGSFVSFSLKHRLHPNELSFQDNTPFCLSSDGSFFALYQERVISTHWIGSGTLRNKFLLPDRYFTPNDIQFIQRDTHLLIRVDSQNEDLGRGLFGLIVRVEDMTLVDSFSLPGKYLALPTTPATSESAAGVFDQELLTAHESTLDLVRLEDRIAASWSKPKYVCDDRCRSNVSPIQSDDNQEFISSSGIQFKIEDCVETLVRLTGEIQLASVVISASFENGEEVEKLVMPELERPMYGGSYTHRFFLKCGTRLVIISRQIFTLWSLPSTLEGNLKLLVASAIQDGQWHTCPHQEFFTTALYMVINPDGSSVWADAPKAGEVFTRTSEETFLPAIMLLAELYQRGDGTLRKEILRYVGQHINTYPVPEDPSKSILPYICNSWTPENCNIIQSFVAALLDSPYGRWVPQQKFDYKSNPIELMLEKAKTQPQALRMVESLIDYCISQARAETDAHFLVPVMSSLPTLIDPKRPHQELAQRTLRRLAYIPVKSRNLIIDHHRTTHPFEFRWKFWVHNPRPLYKSNSPVLQMSRDQKVEPINGIFTVDLYVTSENLLWSVRKGTRTNAAEALIDRPLAKAVRPSGMMNWIKAFLCMVWYKCKLWSRASIDIHSFTPQALDHPAVAAIVENKIGYKYWVMRFLFQCLYYILILVAVFMQVYTDRGNELAGLFIAIIAFAAVFLWLELIQMVRDKKSYLESIYNFVDLIVFGLPLAGSINQLCIIWGNTSQGGNPALLSFSILFVFLHFLFELRVNKTVCHFVTIIIQIFDKIKVFFFIFAGGVIAFSIAMLHLLRSCKGDACDPTDFPNNFLRAMSATYFFMGGVYDPIGPLFNSDRVAFHLMMVVYFFFTVILMLNVLISLISLAFNDGDETWRLTWIENRLRYVESAENMSYRIPGFRRTHDWFPKEIYYSATPQQVRDYNKVSERLVEQNSIVTVKEKTPSSQAILGFGNRNDTLETHSHSHTHATTAVPGNVDYDEGVERKKREDGHRHRHKHQRTLSAATTTASIAQLIPTSASPLPQLSASGTVSEIAQLKYQLQESQNQMLLLLQHLTRQQDQNAAQQAQLKEQQQVFATQLGELQGNILTLLKNESK